MNWSGVICRSPSVWFYAGLAIFLSSLYSPITEQLIEQMTLSDVFGNADFIREQSRFDQVLKGLTIQPSQRFDNSFTNSVRPIFL